MSGEFGSCLSGYFELQIDVAADDCLEGDDELTRLWGGFFKELIPVARAIAYSEAGDSGREYPIMENLRQMKNLKDKLSAIEAYLEPFRRVADDAVRDYIESKKDGAK